MLSLAPQMSVLQLFPLYVIERAFNFFNGVSLLGLLLMS